MKKVFETTDVLQANFIVSILDQEKIPHTVTGLASTDFQGSARLIEIFVDKQYEELVLQIVEGTED